MKRRAWTRIPAILTLIAALPAMGCGGGGGAAIRDLAPQHSGPEVQPVAAEDGAGFGLPAPQLLLRQVSYLPEDRVRMGFYLDPGLPRQLVEIDGDDARFAPNWTDPGGTDSANLAWAVYPFSLAGYSDEAQVSLGWETAPADTDDVYVALGAVAKNAWQWYRPDAEGTAAVESMAPFVAPGGELLVAVVLTGSDECLLDWVRIGANLPPLAVFTADDTTGFAPLAVEFDCTASRDVDGQIITVKYDLDGNGHFEETVFELGTRDYTYTEAGTFDAKLELTDDQGASSFKIVPIIVNSPGNLSPQASLSAAPLTGPPGTEVDFDASASNDPDGTITLVEWDWDGDGEYDHETGTTLTAQHTYNSPGDYEAVVRVFDDHDVSDTDSVSISIGENPNLPPTASIAGGPDMAPTDSQVFFDASASDDPDGSIVLYEWDWQGDGTYDHNTDTPNASHIYGASGDFQATVRVTDDRDATDTASMRVRIYDETEDNDELLQADTLPAFPFADWYGNAGLAGYDGDRDDYFSFNISQTGWYTFKMYHIDAEADLDMKLLKDNGDGTTTTLGSATSTSDDETIVYEFTETGTFYWLIYVWGSAPDDAVADYRLAAARGKAPEAALTATPDTGDAPLLVTLDPSGSTDDGNIVLYEWDFEGDGIYDQTTGGAMPSVTHSYVAGGVYDPVVRVTDDDEQTDTATDRVTVNGDPPVASFTATPSSGARVLEVDLDASASTGVIVEYAWDFDGDGRTDQTKTSGDDMDLATAYYYSTGSFTVSLTVTDNQDRTDTTTRTVNVTGGPDSETEPNNDDESGNTDQDAAAADQLPGFAFADYYAHVGPKADGGDPGDPDDWYKFTVSSTGDVEFYMELFDHVCDIDVALYAEGEYGSSLDSSVGTGDSELIEATIDPGTYYLRVYAYTGYPASGGYRLSGTFLPTP